MAIAVQILGERGGGGNPGRGGQSNACGSPSKRTTEIQLEQKKNFLGRPVLENTKTGFAQKKSKLNP